MRWNDLFCEGKGSRSRLRLPPNGASQKEVPMEEDELYYRPAEKKAFRYVCGGFSNAGAFNLRERKRGIQNARSHPLL
jgi:hypothetical protein